MGILFLELNGHRFTASEEDAAQAVLALAAGKVDEQGFSAFLHAKVERGKSATDRCGISDLERAVGTAMPAHMRLISRGLRRLA